MLTGILQKIKRDWGIVLDLVAELGRHFTGQTRKLWLNRLSSQKVEQSLTLA